MERKDRDIRCQRQHDLRPCGQPDGTAFLPNTEIKEEFGEYLRLKREYKNIALKEASEFIDVKESTLSRYESGEQDMKISNLPLLSLYYGFSMKACLSALHTNDTRELVMVKRRKYQRKDIVYDKDEKLIAKIYTDRILLL